jgi:hypothetical protein
MTIAIAEGTPLTGPEFIIHIGFPVEAFINDLNTGGDLQRFERVPIRRHDPDHAEAADLDISLATTWCHDPPLVEGVGLHGEPSKVLAKRGPSPKEDPGPIAMRVRAGKPVK